MDEPCASLPVRAEAGCPLRCSRTRWNSTLFTQFMKSSHRSLALLLSPVLLIPAFALAAVGANDVWMEHCSRCHGADGTANTKIGKKLKLSDYSSAAVQARMTDDDIYKATAEGVFDEKGKERMPAYKEKLSEKEMRDLVKQVRAFKK